MDDLEKSEKTKESVPLYVVQEEREKRRALERELEILKEMVGDLRAAKKAPSEDEREKELDQHIEQFDEATKRGIEAAIEKRLSKERKELAGAMSMLYERHDVTEFKMTAGKDFETYAKKVEAEIADARRKGFNPAPRSVIYQTLKTQEMANRYRDMEKKAARTAKETYGNYMEEITAPTHNYQSYDNSSAFDGLDGQASEVATKPVRSFKTMSLKDKEAALSNIEF